MLKLHLLLGFIIINPCWCVIDEVVQWNFVNFNFPPGSDYQRRFSPENTILTGMEVGSDRIYLATPRMKSGIPATISTIPRNSPQGSSSLLEAYPDWSWHKAGLGDYDCSGFISVYRMRLDRCDRLWVVDSGVRDSLDNLTRMCPPKLVIFDTKTNRPIRIVELPEQLFGENSVVTNLVIDDTMSTQGTCDDVFVYISDTVVAGIIVYDGRTDRAWRVSHPSMSIDPQFVNFRIGNETLMINDGIVGLAFSPLQRILYFQPLTSNRIFMVSTLVLQQGPTPKGQELPVRLVGRKSSQGIGLAVDPLCDTLFYGTVTETSIASWNPHFNKHELLAYDPERLQFPSEIRWIERDSGTIWILNSNFHKFYLRTVSESTTNIRIFRILRDIRPNSINNQEV